MTVKRRVKKSVDSRLATLEELSDAMRDAFLDAVSVPESEERAAWEAAFGALSYTELGGVCDVWRAAGDEAFARTVTDRDRALGAAGRAKLEAALGKERVTEILGEW